MAAELTMSVSADEEDPRVTILSLSGSLDGNTYIDYEAEINRLIEQEGARHLIVDLSGLSYIASAGVGGFINTQNVLEEQGGFLLLAAPSNAVNQVFGILGLQAIFEVHPVLSGALNKAHSLLAEEG